jgi:hypothetical protein
LIPEGAGYPPRREICVGFLEDTTLVQHRTTLERFIASGPIVFSFLGSTISIKSRTPEFYGNGGGHSCVTVSKSGLSKGSLLSRHDDPDTGGGYGTAAHRPRSDRVHKRRHDAREQEPVEVHTARVRSQSCRREDHRHIKGHEVHASIPDRTPSASQVPGLKHARRYSFTRSRQPARA